MLLGPIFLWHDNWHPMGVLFLQFGFRFIYDAASRTEAKLDTVLKNKTWSWILARSEELVTIQSQLGLVELKDEDTVKYSATKSGSFSCAATYDEIRAKADEVDWWKVLCFNIFYSKACFYRLAGH